MIGPLATKFSEILIKHIFLYLNLNMSPAKRQPLGPSLYVQKILNTFLWSEDIFSKHNMLENFHKHLHFKFHYLHLNLDFTSCGHWVIPESFPSSAPRVLHHCCRWQPPASSSVAAEMWLRRLTSAPPLAMQWLLMGMREVAEAAADGDGDAGTNNCHATWGPSLYWWVSARKM